MYKYLLTLFIFSSLCITFYNYSQRYYDVKTKIYFFNVGQGDSILITTKNKKNIVIDGGPNNFNNYLISKALPFWVSKIDLLIVSHSHEDHLTGLIELLDKYDVKCLVYRSDDEPVTEAERAFRQKIADRSVKTVGFADLSTINNCVENDILLTIYSLDLRNRVDARLKNQNLETITTLVEDPSVNLSAIFTGDATIELQKLIEADLKLKNKTVNIIKVPHQGSRLDLYPSLIYLLKPNAAVIGVGKNSYGHPHKETLDFYKKIGVQIFRTDLDGSVVCDELGCKRFE